MPLQNSTEASLLKWQDGAPHTSQMKILSVRESTLPTSLSSIEDRGQIEPRFSRTPSLSGRREDQ